MLKMVSATSEDTEKIGERLAKKLSGTEIIAMFGDLGAGKTTFTRGLCRGLGVNSDVYSPTFAIVNEYNGKHNIYHFDMYRVTNMENLYSTGYFDYIDNGILIIEWSENIESVLPDDVIKVTISYGAGQDERVIQIEGVEDI